ncbi:MAG: YHS domain-containing (seleno)protein [Bacteroidota bacterium]
MTTDSKKYPTMRLITVLFIFLSFCSKLLSQDQNGRKKQFLIENGVAISGYDPVSYFLKRPLKGKKELTFVYEGIKYQFSNTENQNAFKKTPEKYEPQFGGWCAYAMGSKGEKVEVDPETYKIVNGKLYLFFHTFFSNTLNDWNKDEKNLKAKAESNWEKYIK